MRSSLPASPGATVPSIIVVHILAHLPSNVALRQQEEDQPAEPSFDFLQLPAKLLRRGPGAPSQAPMRVDATQGGALVSFFDAASIKFTHANVHQDIRLNGEPKSGTTWLEQIVRETLARVCRDTLNCSVSQTGRTTHVQMTDGVRRFEGTYEKHVIPNVAGKMTLEFSNAPNLTDDQVVEKAVHLLKFGSPERKWIVIFRDPRDVTISACYHEIKDCPKAAEYVQEHLRTVTSWTRLRYQFFRTVLALSPERVMLQFYEDMLAAPTEHVASLSAFLGMPASPMEAEGIAKNTSLAAMKAAGTSIPQGGARSGKVRRGEACGFRSELSVASAAAATATMREILRDTALAMRWAC